MRLPPPYHLTSVSWVVSTRDNLDQDDRYVTLIGQVTHREGDETYFFTDGTGTVRLDSENFQLPVGPRIVIGGRIDQAYLGFGHLEVDVRQWHYAKRALAHSRESRSGGITSAWPWRPSRLRNRADPWASASCSTWAMLPALSMTTAARAAVSPDAGQRGEHDVVGLDDGLVQVAEELDGNLFLVCPGFLREGAVDADAVDGGVEALIGGDAAGDVAHFLRADTGEGEREEKQDGVLPCQNCR